MERLQQQFMPMEKLSYQYNYCNNCERNLDGHTEAGNGTTINDNENVVNKMKCDGILWFKKCGIKDDDCKVANSLKTNENLKINSNENNKGTFRGIFFYI